MNGLAKDIDNQAGNGYQDGSGRNNGGSGVTDVRVLGLGLVRSDIENVVLTQVEVGRQHQVALGQVKFLDFALAVGVFTNQLHVGTHAIHGHITGHGQGFQYVYFFVAHGEGTRTGYFAQHGNLIVGHAHGHDGRFFQVRSQFFANQVFCLVLGKSAHLQTTQYREVDFALVVHQILLEGRLGGGVDVGECRIQRSLYREVERCGCLRVGGVDGDAQQVFRHDLGIVERNLFSVVVYHFRVLQIRYFLVRSTSGCQRQCDRQAGNFV